MTTTWAWRIPSVVQAVFSVMCMAIMAFVPESPRWLVDNGRRDEALTSIAQTHSNGDETNVIVQAQFQQIIDTLEYEKDLHEPLKVKELFKTPSARKRMILVISCALATIIPGNQIVS